ncbi:MAG: uridine diphosphate-N-acetylglucosamine-binding protein YvcK [Chloroflexota bacterium]|nr:uridine diphosphate-N-acetylglucosamine-binding protein YvcK [Chloroflexota bacterium]MDE2942298.1 uridine diphosphate-N-acetylglucosamine-binding protein YvcK [Chloroflexota bacterium]MDE3268298.1 uridine diphosphate-N-acetylglucosamine-binding protein YvcK [Chloroflexota bacterium]
MLTEAGKMYRYGEGRRVVAIGGGTGLSTLLRGIKLWTENLTAVVSMADDGGSSGRLRDEMKMPPPGDVRACLVALSDADPQMQELFDHRFESESPLGGHNLGNLILAALREEHGSFREGLEVAARLLAVRGAVVPATNHLAPVLMGETVSGAVLRGESAVGLAPELIRRIWLEPEDAVASEDALAAIRQADLIVIGPGSLYTSILPSFLLPGFAEAVAASDAPKVLVCNVATQRHETDGFAAADHLEVFEAHSGVSVSHFLVNSNPRDVPEKRDQDAVPLVSSVDGFDGVLVAADVVDNTNPVRHDPFKLADALMGIVRGNAGAARDSRPADSSCPVSAGRES